MGDDHWRFSIMSVSRPGDCSIAGPSCSACRAFPRGFAFNAVPEEEKLPATTPPPGGPGPPEAGVNRSLATNTLKCDHYLFRRLSLGHPSGFPNLDSRRRAVSH